MKLRNLFENTIDSGKTYEEFVEIIQRARQKNLLVTFGQDVMDAERRIATPIWLISDVPPLNREQWKKLKDTSFSSGAARQVEPRIGNIARFNKDLTDVMTYNRSINPEEGWLRTEKSRQQFEDLWNKGYKPKITILTWKEFVAHLNKEYPLDDDFTE